MKLIDNFLSKHEKRVVGLDILRAAAILTVVYGHGSLLLPDRFKGTYWKFVYLDGVSIFLVLSGFLIGGILLRIINTSEFTRTDLYNFWIRRWFRTLPNYFFVLICLVGYRLIVFHDWGGMTPAYLFFAQNLFSNHPPFFPEAWSLSIEEWFYLLFPLLCFTIYKFSRNKKNTILVSAMIFLAFPLLLRIARFHSGMTDMEFGEQFRKVVILRLDSLMYGVFAAYLFLNHRNLWSKFKWVALCAGIALLLAIKFYPYGIFEKKTPYFFNLESLVILLVLPFFSELKTTRLKLFDSIIIFISIISYSMYLLNLTPVQGHLLPITNNILGISNTVTESTYLLNYTLFWIYTILGSYLLYTLFENRMTQLRDKFHVKK